MATNVQNQNPVVQVNETANKEPNVEMVNLVGIENNQVVTTSLRIAEIFGKQHKNVMQSIKLLDCSEEFRELNFQPSKIDYQNGNIKKQLPAYYVTRDGFMFLVMGFTGKTAAKWKEAYIKAFNDMEAKIRAAQLGEQVEKAIEERDRKEYEEYLEQVKREEEEEAEVDRRADEYHRKRREAEAVAKATAYPQPTGQEAELPFAEVQQPIVENHNGKRVVTSHTLARLAGRRHCSVMRSVQCMFKYADRPGRMFIKPEKWVENPHCHNWNKFFYITESGFRLLCKRTHVSLEASAKVTAAFNASKRKSVAELVKAEEPKAPTTPPTPKPTAKEATEQPTAQPPTVTTMPQTPADLMQRFVRAMGVMMGVDTKDMFNLMDKGE